MLGIEKDGIEKDMWTYNQSNGNLSREGKLVGVGYSGHGEGVNNPAMQAVHEAGPIPEGRYTIGLPYDTAEHGPHVMRLTPLKETETFGREGFLIHGDLVSAPGKRLASHGCIVLGRSVRVAITASGDRLLEVV